MPFYKKLISIFKLLYSQWQAEEISTEVEVFYNAHLFYLKETWHITHCIKVAEESLRGEATGCVQVKLMFCRMFLVVLGRQRWDLKAETFLNFWVLSAYSGLYSANRRCKRVGTKESVLQPLVEGYSPLGVSDIRFPSSILEHQPRCLSSSPPPTISMVACCSPEVLSVTAVSGVSYFCRAPSSHYSTLVGFIYF